MLGEVNASHTGAYYGDDPPGADKTADLGLLYDFDYAGDGVKVAEVVEGGPLDKAVSKIRSGHIIEKDRRRADHGGHGLLPAPQPEGRQAHAPVGVRPGGQDPLGRERQAHSCRRGDRAVVSTLGTPAPQGSGRALGRQDRLRARPIDERLQHAHGVRGIARPQRRQAGAHRRHPVQRRRQHPRAVVRLPERQEILRHRSARSVRRLGAVRQVGQALDRADRREQLLRRAPVPAGLQAEGRRQDARHAGAGHGHVRVVGEADRSDDRVRHPDGRLADAGRQVRRKHADWSPTSRCATSPT